MENQRQSNSDTKTKSDTARKNGNSNNRRKKYWQHKKKARKARNAAIKKRNVNKQENKPTETKVQNQNKQLKNKKLREFEYDINNHPRRVGTGDIGLRPGEAETKPKIKKIRGDEKDIAYSYTTFLSELEFSKKSGTGDERSLAELKVYKKSTFNTMYSGARKTFKDSFLYYKHPYTVQQWLKNIPEIEFCGVKRKSFNPYDIWNTKLFSFQNDNLMAAVRPMWYSVTYRKYDHDVFIDDLYCMAIVGHKDTNLLYDLESAMTKRSLETNHKKDQFGNLIRGRGGRPVLETKVVYDKRVMFQHITSLPFVRQLMLRAAKRMFKVKIDKGEPIWIDMVQLQPIKGTCSGLVIEDYADGRLVTIDHYLFVYLYICINYVRTCKAWGFKSDGTRNQAREEILLRLLTRYKLFEAANMMVENSAYFGKFAKEKYWNRFEVDAYTKLGKNFKGNTHCLSKLYNHTAFKRAMFDENGSRIDERYVPYQNTIWNTCHHSKVLTVAAVIEWLRIDKDPVLEYANKPLQSMIEYYDHLLHLGVRNRYKATLTQMNFRYNVTLKYRVFKMNNEQFRKTLKLKPVPQITSESAPLEENLPVDMIVPRDQDYINHRDVLLPICVKHLETSVGYDFPYLRILAAVKVNDAVMTGRVET
jgi:hypothetical protein